MLNAIKTKEQALEILTKEELLETLQAIVRENYENYEELKQENKQLENKIESLYCELRENTKHFRSIIEKLW